VNSPGEDAEVEAIDRELGRVEDALRRLDDSGYGRCVDCGRPLPPPALEQDPLVERCPEPCGG
jgi:RNA polymerase-binding transcription factor DksA